MVFKYASSSADGCERLSATTRGVPAEERLGIHANRSRPWLLLPRAQAAASRVEKVQRGCIDDAEHGSIADHEGDVHGELAVPMEKFLGAVERIDKPEPIPPRAFFIGRNLPFFRNHRDGAVPFQQSVNDDAMSISDRLLSADFDRL